MDIKIFAYISPICREAPLVQIYMKFCMRGRLADVINRAKFYLNPIRGFDSVGGRIFGFPIKEREVPLTQGLNYRSGSACDRRGPCSVRQECLVFVRRWARRWHRWFRRERLNQ